MKLDILPRCDILPLEALFVKEGNIFPVPFKEIQDFSQESISYFCVKYGLYQLPTTELIEFLSSEIFSKDAAIEIGSGNGCIGRALGIKLTDNKMQTWPNIKKLYNNLAQEPVRYGEDVEEISANDAIIKYKPDVIVGCWVTEKWYPGMRNGNMWGIEEYRMFNDGIKKYILCGNKNVHGKSKLVKIMPPKKYKFPWLISRSLKREDNIIYIFNKDG